MTNPLKRHPKRLMAIVAFEKYHPPRKKNPQSKYLQRKNRVDVQTTSSARKVNREKNNRTRPRPVAIIIVAFFRQTRKGKKWSSCDKNIRFLGEEAKKRRPQRKSPAISSNSLSFCAGDKESSPIRFDMENDKNFLFLYISKSKN